MSLQAPKSFWDYRLLLKYMNEDSIVTIMKMTEEQITSRILLSDIVLTNHNVATSILSGKKDENEIKCITQYRDMLKIVQKSPPNFDLPNNNRLVFNGIWSGII